ncbi:MAG TPA: hypothetical protein VK763_00630 [Terriglobales bacterium]|jgi:hypothetical protein|nr:hypothetical protein [Terriglobales bacterium]
MNIYDTLKTSIASKKPCAIAKPNEPERKVCPYLIGKSSKGEVNVMFYQFGGYSKRGLKEDGSSANWRCSRVAEIASAEISDEPWHQPIQKPKTRGNCVVSVDAEVEGYY